MKVSVPVKYSGSAKQLVNLRLHFYDSDMAVIRIKGIDIRWVSRNGLEIHDAHLFRKRGCHRSYHSRFGKRVLEQEP